ARGIMDVGLKFSVPITYGILTCDTEDQALERAGGRCGNKGEDCARALLDLLKLRQIS
ncbi:MAG: 6,7-dimethyl-8-ribityllumazine synthase, partial [Candidatus Aureabacteria bacterium]|nr:6,7-dimethyl-8-ribityllumazine synthase [Candidatus Auribacterota bacterium]